MKIKLIRSTLTDDSSIGRLYVDDKFECYTLEDRVREIPGEDVEVWKIPGKTAIPVGTYKVILDFSTRFQAYMPHVLDVPGFSGIRIHSGNTSKDTEGCILLGTLDRIRPNWISNSRITFSRFMQKIEEAYDLEEEITLEVTNNV